MKWITLANLGSYRPGPPSSRPDDIALYATGGKIKSKRGSEPVSNVMTSLAEVTMPEENGVGFLVNDGQGNLSWDNSWLIVSPNEKHLVWHVPGNIGVHTLAPASSDVDYRPIKAFVKEAVVVGSLGLPNGAPPYGVNNALVTGMVGAGNLPTYAVMGSNSLHNSIEHGYYVFVKDTSFTNTPGFFSLNNSSDFDIYYSIGHRTSAREDRLKFGADGTLTLMKATGANLLWAGVGDIGTVSGSGPRDIFAQRNLRVGGNLGVGNVQAASTLGSVVGKVEVFNTTTGLSAGFLPLYDSIT